MNHVQHASSDGHVIVENARGQSCIVIVCEHASSYIPKIYKNLGMRDADLLSHAAWDPGAIDVARGISSRLDARLVASGVSRLVYDCNRPPSAMDAMPTQSETIKIPRNADLTADQRRERADLPEHLKAIVMAGIEAGHTYRNQWYWGGEARLRAQGDKLQLRTIPQEEWVVVEEAAKVFWTEIAAESELNAKIVQTFRDYNDVISKAGPPYTFG